MLLTFIASDYSTDKGAFVDLLVGLNIDDVLSIEELNPDDQQVNVGSEEEEILADSGLRSMVRTRDGLEYLSRISTQQLINQYMSNFKVV